MKNAIRENLVPEFEKRGFEMVFPKPDEQTGEIGAAFPFARLRRKTESGFDLAEIQMHKHRPAFRINLGKVPAEGITHELAGHIRAEDVWVHYLPHFGTLYQNRLCMRWFAPRRKLSGGGESAAETVARAACLLPEAEAYWQNPRKIRHIRHV